MAMPYRFARWVKTRRWRREPFKKWMSGVGQGWREAAYGAIEVARIARPKDTELEAILKRELLGVEEDEGEAEAV